MGIMKKIYYIKDIIKILGICKDTYYYWEENNKVFKPKRTITGNYRYWTIEDLKRLKKLTGR